jgi:D-lactate dehydrogenase
MAEAAPPLSTELCDRLRQQLDTKLLTEPGDCWAYGYDNSRQHALPQAVCLAHNETDVATTLELCADMTHRS